MKAPVHHQQNDHRQAQSYRWSSGHLVNQRARLRVLIYTMEHDLSIQPQPWQLLSLKKILGDIDRRIARPDAHTTAAGVRSAYDEKSAIS
jgi:hypothetical protein